LLVDLANLRGGPDNITVVIVRIGHKAAVSQPPPPKQTLWQRLKNWPFPVLLLGLLLAGLAAYVAINDGSRQWTVLTIILSLVAVIVLTTGMVGLFLSHAEEKRRRALEPDLPPPRVYRADPCPLDRILIEKLAHAVNTLEQQVKERQWEADWDSFQQ